MAGEEADIPLAQPMVDLTKETLQTKEALHLLGVLAIAGLKNHGQATFIMRPDGGVAFANPAHVFVHPQAVEDLADKPYRLVRPILGDGRPSYVMWRDGILWEVEPTDATDEKV